MLRRPISALALKKIYRVVLIISAILFIGEVDIQAKEKKALTASDSAAFETWERFSVHGGGFLAGLSSGMVIGSKQLGIGVGLNLEDALGLKTNDFVFRGGMLYRFGHRRRHNFRFSYFGFYRSATKVLETDLEIGDEIYPIGTELTSKFNLQIFKGAYDYSFFMDDRFDFGISIGLFIMPISFTRSTINQGHRVTDFTAPLPVIGLRTDFSVSPRFMIKQSIHLLYLEIGQLKGNITDYNFLLEYNAWKHFGFGLGINTYVLKITAMSEKNNFFDFGGQVEMNYTGLIIYAKFSF